MLGYVCVSARPELSMDGSIEGDINELSYSPIVVTVYFVWVGAAATALLACNQQCLLMMKCFPDCPLGNLTPGPFDLSDSFSTMASSTNDYIVMEP